jgi:hypothetical protein
MRAKSAAMCIAAIDIDGLLILLPPQGFAEIVWQHQRQG